MMHKRRTHTDTPSSSTCSDQIWTVLPIFVKYVRGIFESIAASSVAVEEFKGRAISWLGTSEGQFKRAVQRTEIDTSENDVC